MRKQDGFSLIEMVMVIGLVGVLSIIIAQMFLGQNRLYKTQTSELIVTGEARASLDDIDNFVRQATRVLASHAAYSTGSDTLVLQIQSINSSNQLIPGAYDTVVFYLSSGALKREIFPNASSARSATVRQLAGNVSALNFTYDNGDMSQVKTVTTEISIQDLNSVQNRSISVSSRSFLRNY